MILVVHGTVPSAIFPDKEQEIRSGSKRCLGAHTSKMQIYNHQLEQPALSHRWALRRKLSIWLKARLYHVCSYLVETTEETKNWEESISPSLGWSIEKMRTWDSAPIQYFVWDRRRNLATWQCILNVIGAGGKPGTVYECKSVSHCARMHIREYTASTPIVLTSTRHKHWTVYY